MLQVQISIGRGVGAVIRDAEGLVLAAALWYFEALPDSDITEAIGFRLDLQFSLDMRFLHNMCKLKVIH